MLKTEREFLSPPETARIISDIVGNIVRERQRSLDRGDRVKFTAKATPSEQDEKFGFYKRPTKAELLK